MNGTDRTRNNALMRLHIMGCAEALHAAAMTDYLTDSEAEECLDRLDAINRQIHDLRRVIDRRTRCTADA
jgi:hypothetical protein